MPLFWLVFKKGDDLTVVIHPASALVYARMEAAKLGLDEGIFSEGHQLDAKLSKRVPKNMMVGGSLRTRRQNC
jgi:hypothetical protein